jgi:glycosyltransferase involved in cell wall biosynthesis
MSPYCENGVSPRGLHRLMPGTRVTCFCAHRIIAISGKVRQELIESGAPSKQIDTVYLPVDYHRFANAAKGNIRQELCFDPSHIIITSVGHAVPVKGWDVAIKAFVQVYQQIPSARMVLVGGRTSSEYYNQLTGLIKQYEMEENIKFTGKRDDIPEILKASDVFILPSRSEGLCLALIEAMAAGLPCVAARVGGVPEVINHGENGLLFEREGVEELTGHLVRLIEDQLLRVKIASQTLKRASEFSMKSYVDKVFEAYETLLDAHVAQSQKQEGSPTLQRRLPH